MEKRLLKTLPSLASEPECYLVYDKAVAPFAAQLLAGGAFRGSLALSISDAGKTMDTVLDICRYLMESGATRQALVVALGGGTLTDMAGFAASIYKRGIRYANIPTTLLAQVDAGIGGKTGVNLDGYKNMIGAFRQPEWVWFWPEVLSTLPAREFRCGLAELLKTFLVADASLYAAAVRLFADLSSQSAFPEDKFMVLAGLSSKTGVFEDKLRDLIGNAAEIKAGITERDPYDRGERRKLNLGHTFAHAIEHVALQRGDDIRHGEAVSMGIILAARLSEASLAGRLAADFAACGLPVACPYPVDALVDAMNRDKKAETEGVRFVLLRRIGETEEKVLRPEELLRLL
ncbi:MAG: 3-dehydroquinate synthase [Bacteroidota bacterium]|nr:3-dehydroquinate synthase [Bacteroidota bacterium]